MANKNQKASYEHKVRAKWYFLVDKLGTTVDEVCDLYFISRKTYYKWRKIDLESKTHDPKKDHPETKIKGEVKIFIVEQKNRLNYGPKKMSLLVERKFNIKISTTSIYKFYKKKGLIKRPQKKLEWYKPIKEAVIPQGPGQVCLDRQHEEVPKNLCGYIYWNAFCCHTKHNGSTRYRFCFHGS